MYWFIGIFVVLLVGLVVEERLGVPSVGTLAPDFIGTLQNGNTISLHDYRGKQHVVLFFYPKDFTSGCTAEVCLFRDRYDEVRQFNAVVYGVSADEGESHRNFQKKYYLPFDLITDSDGTVRSLYGASRLRGLVRFAKRITFVIDKEGVIRLAAHHEMRMGNHVDDVVNALKGLQ